MAVATAGSAAQVAHTTAIAEYDAAIAAFEKARGKNDKKAAASASAVASVRSARIRNAELEMAVEGIDFEPWTKPVTSSGASRQTLLSQKEIEESLVKVAAVYNGDFPDSTKHSADLRINSLLKAATKRGYDVKDPRKS